MKPLLPDEAQIETRLAQILRRDSANVGVGTDFDRLTIMLTRSCELRCAYCFVAVREDGYQRDADGTHVDGAPTGDLSPTDLRAAIDLLFASPRPRLGIQLFGGEPTRRADLLRLALSHALSHPERRGRRLEILLTSNGLGLDTELLPMLRTPELMLELSIDGDARGNRFRRGHLVTTDDASAKLERTIEALRGSGVRWFVNATLPPAAASEVMERYRWARAIGAPALQLNYATGMAWSRAQLEAYLSGLQEVLLHHHSDPGSIAILNWQNGADPVPLCADVMVDVDGTILQMGGIFHEKRFPALRPAYLRGSLRDARSFVGLRIPLSELWTLTERTLSPDDWAIFASNVRLGAAVDLVVHLTRRRVGRG